MLYILQTVHIVNSSVFWFVTSDKGRTTSNRPIFSSERIPHDD